MSRRLPLQLLLTLAQRIVADGVSNMAQGVASPALGWASVPLRWASFLVCALSFHLPPCP